MSDISQRIDTAAGIELPQGDLVFVSSRESSPLSHEKSRSKSRPRIRYSLKGHCCSASKCIFAPKNIATIDTIKDILQRVQTLEEESYRISTIPLPSTEPIPLPYHIKSPHALQDDLGPIEMHSSDTLGCLQIGTESAQTKSVIQETSPTAYFVSSFNPDIHDIETWCEEVEKLKNEKNWGDSECLLRVSDCLKGDARVLFDQWMTSDRTWTNFLKEFKPLFPKGRDYASILYDVMQVTSDKFVTYADYARRALLQLNIIKGISDELKTSIVIRGISDPQVRVAAANSNLQISDLVSFLSNYPKSKPTFYGRNLSRPPIMRRNFPKLKCYVCGKLGHMARGCRENSRIDLTSNTSRSYYY